MPSTTLRTALAAALVFTPLAAPAHGPVARPDGHAPIGVMGDHTHKTGEWMLSYRTGVMMMDDARDGSCRVSTADVLARYMMAPERMVTESHAAGVMYAPTDRLTLTAMVPRLRKSMDARTRMGRRYTVDVEGVGDARVSGLVVLHQKNGRQFHLNIGLSLPTGAIDRTDDTPSGPSQPLSYGMQPGSGTWDFLPGATFTQLAGPWSWGAQAIGTIRMTENSSHYALGDAIDATVWGARKVSAWLSASARLGYSAWGDIEGSNPDLSPSMSAGSDPDLAAGERLSGYIGLNTIVTGGPLAGHRFAVEAGAPIHERLDGPALGLDWTGWLGWQKSF